MRKVLEDKFRKRFPDLRYSKLILFRNPSEFSSMYIEKVNPTHHGIIYGQRRRSLKKGSSYIRVGEIYFSVLVATLAMSHLAWVDMLTGYIYALMLQTTVIGLVTCAVLSVMMYYLPFKLDQPNKCEHRLVDNSSYALGI